MVNLWGPGAFFCARPSATEPALTPNNGAGDADDFFKDCTSPEARDGTEWRAGPINALLKQLRGVVRSAGSVPATNLDDLLLAKAMASGHAIYAVATGTANDWIVAPALAVPAYAAGRVLNIIAPATNTATTVNMAVSGLANRRIKKADGTDPAVGDLILGRAYPTIDDGTSIRILSSLPSDVGAALVAEGGRILNYRVYTTTARTVVTGPLNPGLTLWSQTYPKLKAGTRLVVEAAPSIRLASVAATTYARGRLASNPATDQLQNHYLFINNGTENYQPTQFNKFSWTGIAAGNVLIEFMVGQQLTSTGTVVINPSSVDTGGWVDGYSSVFTVYEVEN